MVSALMRDAIGDNTINDVVEIRETTTTRGKCRIRKDGDMGHQSGTSVIMDINREVMMIAKIRRDKEMCQTAEVVPHKIPRKTWSGSRGNTMGS